MNIGETVNNICHNSWVVCAWAVVVIILLVMIFWANKQGFLNEFRSAPIANQRSMEVLGIGNPLRFSSEFSSTNQSGSNSVSDNYRREHLIGSSEAPVFTGTSATLDNYQTSTKIASDTEGFAGRSLFMEGYRNNTEAKLQEALVGLN